MDESHNRQFGEGDGEEEQDHGSVSALSTVSSKSLHVHEELTFKTACNCPLSSEFEGLPKPLVACSDTAIDCALPKS